VILGVFAPLRWLFITPPQRRKGTKIRKGSSGSDRTVQAVLTGVKFIAPFEISATRCPFPNFRMTTA